MTGPPKPRVALFAAPESSPAILFGLYDVLGTVGAVYPDMTTGEPGDELLDVSHRRGRARTVPLLRQRAGRAGRRDRRRRGLRRRHRLRPLHADHDARPADRFAREAAWLRRMHGRGSLIASVCTGRCSWPRPGLLDGRPCAGHWAYADLFGSEYPAVTFDARAILVLATETDGVITAGGVTAWQDLALHVIARLCGAGARDPDRQGPPPRRTPGRTTAVCGDGPADRSHDSAIVRAQAWIADNYATDDPVAAMVERSALLPRTFGTTLARRRAANSPVEIRLCDPSFSAPTTQALQGE